MITATLSSKNQITFPKFILDLLVIESGDQLLIQPEADRIVVKPVGKSLVDSLVGSIKVAESKRGISFDKALLATKKIAAKKLAS